MSETLKAPKPRLANGLYWVNLRPKTLKDLRKGGLPVYDFGDSERATRGERSLSGTVGVFPEGILARSYREPWHIQLEMIEEENAKMAKRDPSWRIIAPPNAATAIEVAKEMYENCGMKVLSWYTRVGDGSLRTGRFLPQGGYRGAYVSDHFRPGVRSGCIGVLPLAISAR